MQLYISELIKKELEPLEMAKRLSAEIVKFCNFYRMVDVNESFEDGVFDNIRSFNSFLWRERVNLARAKKAIWYYYRLNEISPFFSVSVIEKGLENILRDWAQRFIENRDDGLYESETDPLYSGEDTYFKGHDCFLLNAPEFPFSENTIKFLNNAEKFIKDLAFGVYDFYNEHAVFFDNIL